MTNEMSLGRAMRRELKNPVIGTIGLVLFAGSAVLLALFWFTDLRDTVAPYVGDGMALLLAGFTVGVAVRARRRMQRDERGSRR